MLGGDGGREAESRRRKANEFSSSTDVVRGVGLHTESIFRRESDPAST